MTIQPNYNRFDQVGNDANGNPTGSSDGVTGKDKGWRSVEFVPGNRGVQIPEFNELQSILSNKITELGDYILQAGKTLGLQISISLDTTPKTTSIQWVDPNKPGKVYAEGMFHTVPQQTLTITGVGVETVAVTITKTIITEVEDPTLKDPVTTTKTGGNGGAYRTIYVVTPVIKNLTNSASLAGSYDLWTLQDGQLSESSASSLSAVDQILVDYTDEITGNCVLRGMRVLIQDLDTNTMQVTIDGGRSIVSGKMVGYDTTETLVINKSKFDTKTTLGELQATTSTLAGSTPNLTMVYSPADTPVAAISKLNALTLIKKRAGKTTAPFSQNSTDPYEILISTDAPYGPLTDVISVYDVQGAAFVSFVKTAGGFRLVSIPTGDIIVVWVYNATLSLGSDFEITSTGSISTDKRSITLLRQYPITLDSASVLTAANGDSAQLVYPGVGSTLVSTSSASAQALLNVGSSYGILVGQKLYVGTTRSTTTDELVTVAEIMSATQVRLTSNLVATHPSGDYVYVNPNYIGLTVASNETQLILDYTWLLDRTDIVYISEDNKFNIQSGQSNVPAYSPPVPLGVLPLATILLKANGNASDTLVVPYNNQVMSQGDLRALKQDVENLKYNLAIQSIQTSAYNEASSQGLSLRGVLTDPLVNSDILEVNETPQAYANMAIDPDTGTLSPVVTIETDKLVIDTVNSNCFLGTRAVSLGHTLIGSTTISNLSVTDSEILQGTTNIPKPSINVTTGHYLGPADRASTFTFLNANTRLTETLSSTLEGGNWKTRQNNTPWLNSLALFLPSQTIKVEGRNLPSFTDNTKVTITALTQDGVTSQVVGQYALVVSVGTSPGTMKITYNGGTPVDNLSALAQGIQVHGGVAGMLTLNMGAVPSILPQTDTLSQYQVAIDGTNLGVLNAVPDISGIFTATSFIIPAYKVSGHNARTVSLLDHLGNSIASTIFGATPSQAEILPIVHDSLAASLHPQLAQTYIYPNDTFVRGVNLYFSTVSSNPLSWVEVQLRDTLSDGSPSANLLARVRINQSSIPANSAVVATFPDPVFNAAGKAYTICLLASNSDYAVSKSVVGHSDTTGKLINGNPIPSGAIYVSPDGNSWTIQSEAALTLQLLECSFRADQSSVVFLPVTPTKFSAIPFIIGRAQQLVPRNCSVEWSYSLGSNTTTLPLLIDIDGTLAPQVLPQTATSVTLRANLRSSSTSVSAIVGKLNTTLLSLDPGTDMVYVSRAPSGLSTYTQLRVTLQLLTSTSNGDLAVKLAGLDDPYGYGFITLSGIPVAADNIVVTVDSHVTNFTYAPVGTPTLLDFTTSLVSTIATALGSGYVVTSALSGSNQVISIHRVNNKAFVTADISAVATPAVGSTLAVVSVTFNYKAMVLQTLETTPVDNLFTKYVYTLTGMTPSSPYTFRLKLEAGTSNVLTYPRIRNITAVVSS